MTMPDPYTTTIAGLRADYENGTLSSRDAVRASLDRIAEIDRQGPALHAVIEVNPAALEIADRMDAERANGTVRSPLHGIPILLKDNIAITGMENTSGSLAMVGAKPREDAFLVRCLIDAGAVIIGKTNLSEWANFRSTRSTSGWSGRGGQTLNPHQLDRNPSGSSSGSGSAVAAGYAPVSLGSETNGSIVSPANANGVVGIKPTVGLVSRMGVIPISHHQDTVGPMARTVADAAAVLSVIAHADPEDPAVSMQDAPQNGPSYPRRPADHQDGFNYAHPEILTTSGLRGARIGVWRPEKSYSAAVDAMFDASLQTLRDAGAELVDNIRLDVGSTEADRDASLRVLLSEIASGVANYIERYVSCDFPIRTLEDVIAFNRQHADRELRWFGHDLLERAVDMPGLDDDAYLDAVRHVQKRSREHGIDALLERHELNAIVAPSGPPTTRIDLVNGDHGLGASSTPSAVAGYPIVTVPAGNHFGLPMNISFMGTAFSEATLIRLAYAFEQATQARIDPTFAPAAILPPHH